MGSRKGRVLTGGERRRAGAAAQRHAAEDGEDVPLPPVDETPLELPAELFGDEVRERQENGGTPQATATPPVPYIVFDHVSKSFGDLHVLDDVSFEVLTGETL